MKTPILGSSYVARSVNAADNRMVNLFPEIVTEGGKEPAFLSRCPGLQLVASVGAGPIRGLWAFVNNALADNYYYVVSGDELYQVNVVSGISNFLGAVSGSPSPVSISDNGTQIFIACNGPSYVYNTSTFVFAQVTDADFPGAVTVDFLDGYFVVNQPNSQKVWTSALYDGLSWDATHFASAEGSPDGVVAIAVSHKELWVFGSDTTEVWYNAGNPGFPLAPIQGSLSEIGCAGAYTIAKMDNALFWVSSDPRGAGIVYRSKGYSGERVSTHAVEWQMQKSPINGDFLNAVGYTYQQDGHSFYMLTQNGGDTTWSYDASTQAWHERQSTIAGEVVTYSRHRGNCYAFVNGVTSLLPFNIVGDYETGSIYNLNLEYYFDDGPTTQSVQRWLRSWRALPPNTNNLTRSAHHSLQLDCETGVGNADIVDPQVSLSWSDDGGHTWSTPRAVSMGVAAAYGTRVIWRRLGMTMKLRDRVYEVTGTDPCKVIIMGADLHMSNTDA